MRTLTVFTVFLLALLTAGCSRNPMAGRWHGTHPFAVGDPVMTLTLSQNGDQVSGSGKARSQGGESYPVTVKGTIAYPNVSLTISVSGYPDASFKGRFAHSDSIIGEYGSGTKTLAFAFVRR
jgi:hypothetical protein